jgi:hypothetical protein
VASTPRIASLAVLALAAAACSRTMGEEDCQMVATNLREVWSAEAQKATTGDEPDAEKATAVVKSEGDRLVADWLSECKQELQGRRVDPKELDCLLAARTIDAVQRCAP